MRNVQHTFPRMAILRTQMRLDNKPASFDIACPIVKISIDLLQHLFCRFGDAQPTFFNQATIVRKVKHAAHRLLVWLVFAPVETDPNHRATERA